MAVGNKDDFRIHNDLAMASYLERLNETQTDINGASNGALRMMSDGIIGDFKEEDFVKEMKASAKIIKHRDPSGTRCN